MQVSFSLWRLVYMIWMEAELMPKEVLDWHSPRFLCLYSHPPSNTHTYTHTLYPYTEHMCFYSFGSVMGSGWYHTFMCRSINCICLWDKGQIVLHIPTFLPGRQGICKSECVCVCVFTGLNWDLGPVRSMRPDHSCLLGHELQSIQYYGLSSCLCSSTEAQFIQVCLVPSYIFYSYCLHQEPLQVCLRDHGIQIEL